MGFPDDEIVDPAAVPSTLRCIICTDVFQEPVYWAARPCQHVFCKPCILQALERAHECPTCRAIVRPRDLQPHQMILNMLDDLQVRCSKRCGWTGRLCDRPAHMSSCPMMQIEAHCSTIRDRDTRIAELEEALASKDSTITDLETELEAKQRTIDDHDRQIQNREAQIAELETKMAMQRKLLQLYEEKVAQERLQKSAVEEQLAGVRQLLEQEQELRERERDQSTQHDAFAVLSAAILATIRQRDLEKIIYQALRYTIVEFEPNYRFAGPVAELMQEMDCLTCLHLLRSETQMRLKMAQAVRMHQSENLCAAGHQLLQQWRETALDLEKFAERMPLVVRHLQDGGHATIDITIRALAYAKRELDVSWRSVPASVAPNGASLANTASVVNLMVESDGEPDELDTMDTFDSSGEAGTSEEAQHREIPVGGVASEDPTAAEANRESSSPRRREIQRTVRRSGEEVAGARGRESMACGIDQAPIPANLAFPSFPLKKRGLPKCFDETVWRLHRGMEALAQARKIVAGISGGWKGNLEALALQKSELLQEGRETAVEIISERELLKFDVLVLTNAIKRELEVIADVAHKVRGLDHLLTQSQRKRVEAILEETMHRFNAWALTTEDTHTSTSAYCVWNLD